MINSTNTIHIDGTVLNNEEFINIFTFSKNDKFSQWVVRPLAIVSTIGMGIAIFFASAFFIVLSLAMIPLFALSFWAIKTNIERDMAKNNPVVDTQTTATDEPVVDTQAAI